MKTSITFKVSSKEKQQISHAADSEQITVSDYIRQAVMNKLNALDENKTTSDDSLTNVLQRQIETKDQQIERLQQALDQSQQLQAISQKTIESKQLKIDEYQRPKPLITRLKAVFVGE